jgi:hypothetical protein
VRSLAHHQRPAVFSLKDPLPSVANVPVRAALRLRHRRAVPAGGAAPTDA